MKPCPKLWPSKAARSLKNSTSRTTAIPRTLISPWLMIVFPMRQSRMLSRKCSYMFEKKPTFRSPWRISASTKRETSTSISPMSVPSEGLGPTNASRLTSPGRNCFASSWRNGQCLTPIPTKKTVRSNVILWMR